MQNSPSRESSSSPASQEIPQKFISVFTTARTRPYTEPYKSKLRPPILFIKIHINP